MSRYTFPSTSFVGPSAALATATRVRATGEAAAHSSRRGVIYVEVVMSLIPILLIFFGICQMSLLFAAKMVVQHAATRAARAAMVVLEDDPKHYDDAARGSLLDGTSAESGSGSGSESSGTDPSQSGSPESSSQPLDSTQGAPPEALANLDEAYSSLFSGAGDAGGGSADEARGGPRWNAIRAAAYHPLAVLAPSLESLLGHSLDREIAQGAIMRILGGRLIYNLGAASITLHSPGSDEVLTQIGSRERIMVRVAFLMPCGVPMVSRLICSSREDLLLSSIGLNDRAQEMRDKTEHVESTAIRNILFAMIPHLTLLTAEAIMPNQGANYYD